MIPLKMFPELEKQASCSMCGKCCEAIRLPMSHEKFSPDYTEVLYVDKEFMFDNFVPMSQEEALSINPQLLMGKVHPDGKYEESPGFYYSCKMYDKETKKCNAHDLRPKVCREFPWYGNSINNHSLGMHLSCSYWQDVPVEYWASGVNI